MSNHEYFKKMSALSAIGQISAQEDKELSEHLNECVSCREIYFDYARVIRQQLPQADSIRWRIKSAIPASRPDPEVRARFLARARADGIDFSLDAERPNSAKSNRSRRASRLWPALAIAPVLVLAVLFLWIGRRYELVPRFTRTEIDPRSVQLVHENDDLRAQLATSRQVVEQDAATIGQMKKERAGSLELQQKLQKQLDESLQHVAKLSDNLRRTEAEKDEMVRASQGEGATIGSLRGQYESLSHERAEMLNSHAILEAQVRNLTAALEEKSADLERERQLMAVSKDVRQLMGARNLHIMDVHDMGGGGKDVRAFGRVFYAEGQSLIFYAFDLPNGKLTPAKYTFQAWGQREAASQSARNLGTFQVDDHEQRRWVLKVTDTALLTGIDSVFVTAESLDVAKSPGGKKLLYAYLAGQPNHP